MNAAGDPALSLWFFARPAAVRKIHVVINQLFKIFLKQQHRFTPLLRLHGSAYKYASQMSLTLACEDMAVNMLFTVIGA
jgi:hypothetical protein